MDNEFKLKKLIKRSAYIIIIALIIAVIALIILKYQVEGEQNMPFKLSNIIVVSNAEGYQKEEKEEYKWDADIYQNNDIYLNIEKNKNYKKTEAIKSIVIENIKIDENPEIGTITFYRPYSEESKMYTYEEEYKINDKIEYLGDVKSDIENLKISNQGSTLVLRVINEIGKKYTSNEDEFEHNGKLLNKVGVTYEQIKAKVSFDLIINLESNISFRTNIKLNLPVGDITKEGASNLEINNMKDIIFKREQ